MSTAKIVETSLETADRLREVKLYLFRNLEIPPGSKGCSRFRSSIILSPDQVTFTESRHICNATLTLCHELRSLLSQKDWIIYFTLTLTDKILIEFDGPFLNTLMNIQSAHKTFVIQFQAFLVSDKCEIIMDDVENRGIVRSLFAKDPSSKLKAEDKEKACSTDVISIKRENHTCKVTGTFDQLKCRRKYFKKKKDFSGALSMIISACVPPAKGVSPILMAPVPVLDKNVVIRKISAIANCAQFATQLLKGQTDTDTILVSGNGKEFPCHSLFLTGNSPVFQAMLKNTSFVEGNTKRIIIPDIGALGISSMLCYLYGDEKGFCKNVKTFEAARQVLIAAEKYALMELKARVKRFMLLQPMEWYTVEGALMLFSFASGVEDLDDLKVKIVEFLKTKIPEVQSSQNYIQLFKKSPSAAMDLCNLFMKWIK